MGDEESRKEDARIEELQDRGLRSGKLAECPVCGDIRTWSEIAEIRDEMEMMDETEPPMCRRCRDRREEDADGEEEG